MHRFAESTFIRILFVGKEIFPPFLPLTEKAQSVVITWVRTVAHMLFWLPLRPPRLLKSGRTRQRIGKASLHEMHTTELPLRPSSRGNCGHGRTDKGTLLVGNVRRRVTCTDVTEIGGGEGESCDVHVVDVQAGGGRPDFEFHFMCRQNVASCVLKCPVWTAFTSARKSKRPI